MANSHRRYNHLGILLEVDGVIYEELEVDVVQLYKKLYQETEEWRPFMEGLEFDQIRGTGRGWLENKEHVNWDFLLHMLRSCGFGEKERRWISF